jgi:hypothetical protein
VDAGHAVEQGFVFFRREIFTETSDALSDLSAGARDRFSSDLVHLSPSTSVKAFARLLQVSVRQKNSYVHARLEIRMFPRV